MITTYKAGNVFKNKATDDLYLLVQTHVPETQEDLATVALVSPFTGGLWSEPLPVEFPTTITLIEFDALTGADSMPGDADFVFEFVAEKLATVQY